MPLSSHCCICTALLKHISYETERCWNKKHILQPILLWPPYQVSNTSLSFVEINMQKKFSFVDYPSITCVNQIMHTVRKTFVVHIVNILVSLMWRATHIGLPIRAVLTIEVEWSKCSKVLYEWPWMAIIFQLYLAPTWAPLHNYIIFINLLGGGGGGGLT